MPDAPSTANGPSGIVVGDDKVFFVNSGAITKSLTTAAPIAVSSHSLTLGHLLGFNLEDDSSSSSSDATRAARLHGLGDVGSFSLASQYAAKKLQGSAVGGFGDTNAYSLAYDGSSGTFYVADAAANQIVAVKDGLMRNVAFFPPTCAGATQGSGDAVPTSVTIGPDGFLYVGTLELAQFLNTASQCTTGGATAIKGKSNIYRIDPSKTGYTATAADVFAGGFTTITDIHYDSHSQSLYVVEFAAGDVVKLELKSDHHTVVPGKRTVLGTGALSSPNGVTTDGKGNVFVTDCSTGGTTCTQRVVRVNF